MQIDTTKMVKIESIAAMGRKGRGLARLASEALGYLTSHRWCARIEHGWLDRAWEGILGVFYFELVPTEGTEADRDVWVIVGDIPPAYIDSQECRNGAQALRAYAAAMRDWVDHVRLGLPIDDLIPVNVPAEIEFAELLSARITFIELELLPQCAEKSTEGSSSDF